MMLIVLIFKSLEKKHSYSWKALALLMESAQVAKNTHFLFSLLFDILTVSWREEDVTDLKAKQMHKMNGDERI